MVHDWKFVGTDYVFVHSGGPDPDFRHVAEWECGRCGTQANVPIPDRSMDFDSRGRPTGWEPEEDPTASPPGDDHFSVHDETGTLDADRDDCDLMTAGSVLAS
jgi:hypothetical protein